jgi:hypothetical protein
VVVGGGELGEVCGWVFGELCEVMDGVLGEGVVVRPTGDTGLFLCYAWWYYDSFWREAAGDLIAYDFDHLIGSSRFLSTQCLMTVL